MKYLEESHAMQSRRHRLGFETAEDREEFYNEYDASEQDSVRDLHDRMMRIDAAPNRHAGSKQVKSARYSAKRLEALHKEWVDGGRDWRVLVNKARYPHAREPRLPQAFRDHIRATWSENKRKNAPAYRKLIRQWELWLTSREPRYAIPGFDECPRPGPKGRYPKGWSEKNLNRFAPTPAETAMIRIGVAAAMALLPKIPGTREGVRFLEYVSGDDVWHDRKAHVFGYGECRVVQFGMMDYAASYYLDGFIQRPIIPRPDGTTEQLKRRDFLWCVAMMLERYGYPLDYVMHIICERGTATLSQAEARFLYEISEGHIVVGWNTMQGEFVAAWDERQVGNSNAKPWHESFHNIFHNEQADTPGQVGMDRDHSPAELQGSDRMVTALNDVAMILTPEQRAQWWMPYPDMRECMAQTVERVHHINTRKKHACEGFGQVLDWRPRGLPVLPMPESELPKYLAQNAWINRSNIEQVVEYFPRPESPRERMLKLSQGARFQRLPAAVYRRFYEDLHETRRVADDGSLQFERKIDGAKRQFHFEPATPDEALRPGTEVTGFFRPDGSAIHLFGGKDTYLLTWPAVIANRRGDRAAKQLDYERQRSFLNQTINQVRKDRAKEIEVAAEGIRRNTQILTDAGLITDELPPVGEHTLAIVQSGCTPTAAAVADVTAAITAERAATKQATAREQQAVATRRRRINAAEAEASRALLES